MSEITKTAEDIQKTFPSKYLKKLKDHAEEYMEKVEGAENDEVKKFIIIAEQNIYDIEHEIDNHPTILKLKEDLKETLAPYNESKAVETAKIKYCLFKLDERNVKA